MQGHGLGLLRRWRDDSTDDETGGGQPGKSGLSGTAGGREIDFSAYSEDCRIYAYLQLAGERLSNHLNEHSQYDLNSVLLVALEDGRGVELNVLTIRRDELIAVRGTGPRGDPARRSRRRPSPVGLRAGPYMIRGYLHAPPGSDALLQFRRRPQWVPLTEASIEHNAGGLPHQARVGTLIVNRELVDWIDHAKDAEVRRDLPAEMRIDPRAKDMTGEIRMWRHQRPAEG